jgi:iron uptake system component EfeO
MAYVGPVDRVNRPLRSDPVTSARRPGVQAALFLMLSFVGLIATGCRFVSQGANTVPRDAAVVTVRVTPVGCDPEPASVGAGPVEFVVRNVDAPAISEVEVRTENLDHVLGEQENLVQGLSGRFSTTLSPGYYVVDCPGAANGRWAFVVSG